MKVNSDTIEKIRRFKRLCGDQPLSGIISTILGVARTMGESRFREEAAGILGEVVCGAEIVPDEYQAYRRVVKDGIFHFISMLPIRRLATLLAHQASMDENADAGRRLLALASQIPTLHKLGQTIARNRHIDPRVRSWLVQLENGDYGADAAGLCRMIEERLGADRDRYRIHMNPTLLSEASVGCVVPFEWQEIDTGDEQKGVFKVSRPDIETLLEEELAALDRMAEFFDDHRHLYPLGDFRYKELFGDVKAALLKELDFRNEQENLALARRFYRKNKRIHVPQLAPFSSRHFTAMARIEGGKVTDVIDSRKGRKQAADAIFRAVICAPLFSAEASPVFHGDPHAGNIFSKKQAADEEPAITLLDWSQTGRLERGWRINLLKLIQGTVLDSTETICRAVAALSPDASQDSAEIDIAEAVKTVMAMEEYRKASLVKKTFVLLERLSFQGVRFHGDLLLFRKSFFTLDGLMHDLDREFNMDLALMAYIRDLIVSELPRRIAVLLAPISDAPEKYRSLLSNRDLQMLLLCQASEFVKKNAHKVRDFMERYAGMIDSLFSLPKFFSSRTAKVLLGLYFMYRMRESAAET